MSPYNIPIKNLVCSFECDKCGFRLEDMECTVDTWTIYCEGCDNDMSLRIIKLKVVK